MKSKKKKPIGESETESKDKSPKPGDEEEEIQIDFGHYGEKQGERDIGSATSPSLTLDDSKFRTDNDDAEEELNDIDEAVKDNSNSPPPSLYDSIELPSDNTGSLSFANEPSGENTTGGHGFDDDEQELSGSLSLSGFGLKDGSPPPVDEIDEVPFGEEESGDAPRSVSELNIDSIYSSDSDSNYSPHEDPALVENINEHEFGDIDATEVVREKTEKLDLSQADVSMVTSKSESGFSGSPPTMPTHLTQSENFRVAQQKVKDLEKENERLRSENEELAAAAETFRNKADDLEQRTQNAESKYKDLYENVDTEKEILLESISAKDREVQLLKQDLIELEKRLHTGVKKIRVRERELENRLELVKMEGKALLQSKDDMILSLKRQIDQVSMELENARTKVQESSKVLSQKQEILRKTVKTLRLALSLLETEDVQLKGEFKKVD